MRILAYSIVLMCLLAPPVMADIYKCVLEDGTVKFSDEPCSNDAQVAFQTNKQTFDEIIGQGYPYRVMPLDREYIKSENITEHAKKIAARIIPDENINKVIATKQKQPHDGWHIYLRFGPKDEDKYSLTFIYRTYPSANEKSIYVYLNFFYTSKEGHLFDPPIMADAKKFKRKKIGTWVNNIDYSFPKDQSKIN